ncbi:Sjogren's syndrome/scleroderma autoantigen 1 family protein [Haloplanus ruber]|uniref:Sjogren's syndrome/scleroderma autoantigen 1 family protein n=1 Tax=Haloplanus ruber TaxID=869892 RepID=A0ABD6CVF0_9EURY|nr:Sjogren's syndrome/scleroderma autoantigen 1 family protein [Haloplanus ruber]
MSEFDKEAERERLREKYERDREKRAATQRMSELLLKGATMTNSHCDSCGDPIFRYDGEEFCPTCQAPDADPDAEAASPPEAETSAADPSDADPADAAATDTTADAETAPDETTDAARPRTPAVARDRQPAPADGADPSTPVHSRDAGADDASVSSPRSAPALDDTRASLSRTLDRFARAAEETDDPRRARDLLAAAREAAETLAALDSRGRR